MRWCAGWWRRTWATPNLSEYADEVARGRRQAAGPVPEDVDVGVDVGLAGRSLGLAGT
jgi:hypothetical protein